MELYRNSHQVLPAHIYTFFSFRRKFLSAFTQYFYLFNERNFYFFCKDKYTTTQPFCVVKNIFVFLSKKRHAH